MEPTHSTTHYLWIAAYEAAVFETDNALMPGRILEALAAIEQRLLSPIDINGHDRARPRRTSGPPGRAPLRRCFRCLASAASKSRLLSLF